MPDIHTIGRTVAQTICTYTKGGTAKKKYKHVLMGEHTEEAAQRRLRSVLNDQTIVVLTVKHEKKHYVMNVEDFISNARVTRTY